MSEGSAAFSLVTQPISDSAALCRIAGKVDAHAFETLEGEFGKLLSGGVKALILEASGLEDITSAALGAIINMTRALEGRGGVLVLTLLRPGVEGLLDMLGVKESLVVADSLEAAKKRIASVAL